jgi:hypothetical protein
MLVSTTFLCCLYNYANSNKINANVIKNSHQLDIANKFSVCSQDIDPDKYFYNTYNFGSK